MKKIFYNIALAAALMMGATSCVQDLTIKPSELDPSIKLPEQVLNTPEAFNALLAKCYQGLACSGSDGQDGGPDISGVDGGYGQYLRAMFHLQCLSTDEAVCCWNDQTLYDIHNLCWSTSDTFVAAAYYRVFFQVGLCNEFIRQAGKSNLAIPASWTAEARALRLLSYYHAIDLFGNVPFFTEDNSVGAEGPEQKKRADLWDWMVEEGKKLTSAESALPKAGEAEYGRIDQGAVKMILAKLYLNAQIWKAPDANYFQECGNICEELIKIYPLHDNYADLFSADNHLFVKSKTYLNTGDEIIFAVPQDGLNIRSYGATNYVIFACTGGDMDAAGQMGISSGWGGLSLTSAFTRMFDENDERAMFFKGHGQEIADISDFKSGGYKSMKFRNINHDGTAAQEAGFVDTDYPIFRIADAYLMAAECQARGASNIPGFDRLNAVHHRAGLTDNLPNTLENIIAERGRELYHELCRRQDLIRFGMFTTDKYLWDYKGGVREGKAVDSKYNLYPLTSSDVNANSKLTQNAGY